MSRVAVVTGSNKGIGYAIVKSLCKRLQHSDVVYVTSRDENRGKDALKKLEKEGLHPRFHQLDISDEQSVRTLHDHLIKTHGGLDILVNNAGIFVWAPVPIIERNEKIMKTNFFDTVNAYNILSSAIRPHGRVVFVASRLGPRAYQDMSSELKIRLRDAQSEEDVQILMKKFIRDFRAGIHAQQGWQPGIEGWPAYNTSKLGIITMAKVYGAQMVDDPREGILINSCSPGRVATDMTGQDGRHVDEGTVSSIYLALLPTNAMHPQGSFIDENVKVVDFWLQ